MIQSHAISHTYTSGHHAIENITFSVAEGQFVAIVGESGVGKSTLLRVLGGLLEPSHGLVKRMCALDEISFVFQQNNLLPWRTVRQNIALPLEIKGQKNISTQQVDAAIRLIGLEPFADSFPAQLSGGMAQRVALARALVTEPTCLLLDEPFGALDAITRERLSYELLRLRQANPTTVVMVTHDINEAVLLADVVLVLGGRPGRLVSTMPIAFPRPRTATLVQTAAFQQAIATVRAIIADSIGR